ncbi:hypothetical protein BpHYR1_050926 [Brachionus plicatilis]|uniref:Uncharacterized protein n=1 Tax=Brachionus plicatilis TaxID=10195 RepID=A0A3M7R2K2_BRAPC|nr:hypothetical protein BpHYR1_050926 [Brachionus plicatilis]
MTHAQIPKRFMQGFYDLYSIIERTDDTSSLKTWIKHKKYTLYISSQIVENCSDGKNKIKCISFNNLKTPLQTLRCFIIFLVMLYIQNVALKMLRI